MSETCVKGYFGSACIGRPERFYVEFEDWEPDHCHWRGPSHLSVFSSGRVIAAAAYLANQHRTDAIFDRGDTRCFWIDFELLKDGVLIAQDSIGLACLEYRQERQPVGAERILPEIVTPLQQANQIRTTQRIGAKRNAWPGFGLKSDGDKIGNG